MNNYYKEDLAYIHDTGFSEFALKSAPGIIEILKRYIKQGLVVDLGCGSGLLAEKLAQEDYRVLGIDLSTSMIAIARKRVPFGEFKIGSIFRESLPHCGAVTAIGECFNYLFDPENNERTLLDLFRKVYNALNEKGVFIFDLLEPGQLKQNEVIRNFSVGNDWVVLVEKQEDQTARILTRRIITFHRRSGLQYRRSDEVHLAKLYESKKIVQALRQTGFRVRLLRGYGQYRLNKNHAVFVAWK